MSSIASDQAVWTAVLAGVPGFHRKHFDAMIASGKPPFLDYAIDTLLKARPRTSRPASILLEYGAVLRAVSDPSLFSLEDSLRLARTALAADPRLDQKLLAHLADESHNWPRDISRTKVMRVLEVIDAISDCRCLLVPLMKFAALPDHHLRSKAVKLIGRASRNPSWADSVLRDTDPRVRANLIEAAARCLGLRAEPLLRKAASDPHHRVRAASLLGLSRLGDQDSRRLLEHMAKEGSPNHRKAAAWALAELLSVK